jgi:hypothetical protein
VIKLKINNNMCIFIHVNRYVKKEKQKKREESTVKNGSVLYKNLLKIPR